MNASHPFRVYMRNVFIPFHVIALILSAVMYATGVGA